MHINNHINLEQNEVHLVLESVAFGSEFRLSLH